MIRAMFSPSSPGRSVVSAQISSPGETDLQEFGKAKPVNYGIPPFTSIQKCISLSTRDLITRGSRLHIAIEAFAPGSRILIRENRPRLLDHSLQKP